jgi:hypothetical protein
LATHRRVSICPFRRRIRETSIRRRCPASCRRPRRQAS